MLTTGPLCRIKGRASKTLLTLTVLSALLGGCGIPLSPKAIEEKPEGVFIKQTVAQLVTRDFAPIEAVLDPDLKIVDVPGTLEKTASYFPEGKATSVEFLGWSFEQILGQDRRTNLTAEYGYGNSQWVLVMAQVRGEPGRFRISSLRVQKVTKSLAALNALTFEGKGWINYFFLGAMTLAFGITVYALILCVRTEGLRRKWLWVLFILFGICAFNLNWTTGGFRVAFLQVNLFSAAAIRNGFAGPWVLTFCIPLGAMVFLFRRRRTVTPRADAKVASAP